MITSRRCCRLLCRRFRRRRFGAEVGVEGIMRVFMSMIMSIGGGVIGEGMSVGWGEQGTSWVRRAGWRLIDW